MPVLQLAIISAMMRSGFQKALLDRFGATECVDTHCHILPGVDDGPATLNDTLALCRVLVRDGITTVIATPHQLGRFESVTSCAAVREAVAQLQATLEARRMPIRVVAGGEVRLDPRIPQLLAHDQILTLADGRKYLLLELPTAVSLAPDAVLPHLAGTGVTVVLAHSERYASMVSDPDSAEAWVAGGAALQVNAGGLVGAFGEASQAAAVHWIERGWVSLIATDAHSVGTRRPRMTEAAEFLAGRFGQDIAKRLCFENPQRILEGAALMQQVQ
jgi:protein-tyrosine phosphatase